MAQIWYTVEVTHVGGFDVDDNATEAEIRDMIVDEFVHDQTVEKIEYEEIRSNAYYEEV